MNTNKSQHHAVHECSHCSAELLSDVKHSLREIEQGKYIEFDTIKEFKKKLSLYCEGN